MKRRILALCLAMLAPAAVAQHDVADAARAAADQLAQAKATLAATTGSRDRVRALTGVVRGYEDGLAALRDGIRQAAIREQTLQTALAAKSDEVAQLLGVLQIISRTPAPLQLLHPAGPVATARSGMIVADVTPALQAEAAALQAQLSEIALLRDLQENAIATLREGLEGAQAARANLSQAIQDRTDLPTRFDEDRVQTALLLASTDTLDAFAKGLGDTSLPGPANPDTLAAKGALPLPVQGQILRGFNAADAAGVSRPGVIIATRPRALVTAPAPATILFRGPLLDYGNVIIVEPTTDVMFVIAGLAEVYGEAGQIIAKGAPLGLLGGTMPTTDGDLTEIDGTRDGGQSQTLYLEVRDGQTPVDPATWFALE